MKTMINVALPKGRLGEKVYAMFEKAGYECPSIKEVNRKLIFENEEAGVRYFWVKPSDVAIYVERGAADVGVAGKDILLEYAPDVYELLDLNLGKCRMAVAAKKDFRDNTENTLRVALTCDRKLGFTTFMADPMMASVMPEEGQKLFDDMLEAQKEYLPAKWFE